MNETALAIYGHYCRCCKQARELDAGRQCNALNHNADSLQKVINIARLFTGLAFARH